MYSGNCFQCGEKISEADKFWPSTGLCPKCRENAQAKDEANFWEKKVLTQLDEIVKEIKDINKTLKKALK